jgi:beta-barrel assembly-enhancing protease
MDRARLEWSGFYYDGRTAQREPVRIAVGATGLRLRRSDGSEVQWPFDGLRQTQSGFGGERLRIEFGIDPVEVLVVTEDGLPEAVQATSPRVIPRLRARRSTAGVLAWSVGALAFVALSYVWGAPRLADRIAPKIPIEWEESLGRSVVAGRAPAERLCRDSAALAGVRAVVDRLLGAVPHLPYQVRVYIARDTLVNAFAAPGGYIVVNSGLLEATATPEQLAGVLAHEIQHVLHRHSTRAVIREAPLRLALASLSGGGLETAATVAGTLGALRYRRADEAQADRDGMRLLEAAQVDPAGIVELMRTLETRRGEAPRLVSYLSSHPQTAERVATLETMARQARVEAKPLLDPIAWRRVQTTCGR